MSFTSFFQARARLACAVGAAAAALALAGCSSVDGATRRLADAATIYRPDVVQGNSVSAEQVRALRAGMTRVQVREILGTPLVGSVFHADRWDYVFSLQRLRMPPQQYRLTLFFKDDTLERFEGDDMPGEDEFVQRIDARRSRPSVPVLQATDAQLSDFAAAQAQGSGGGASAAHTVAQDVPSPRPAGSYPPLE